MEAGSSSVDIILWTAGTVMRGGLHYKVAEEVYSRNSAWYGEVHYARYTKGLNSDNALILILVMMISKLQYTGTH